MPRGRRLASASRGPDQGRGSIMKIDGGCHCGYITYEAEADPERPPSAIARLPASLRIGVSHRRPRRRRHIQNHRWRPNHLCKDRRKRRKTSARILPSMWNTNLLDRRRRRAEILLHPCRDRPPTCCACAAAADLVSLTTRLGDRSRLHSQAGNAVSYGALIGCEESVQKPASRKSACMSLRQGSPRSKHVPGDQRSPGLAY